jgi:hypothetical protein
MSFLGGGFALWGGLTLGSRLGPRRKLGHQIEALEEEKRLRRSSITVVPVLGSSNVGLRLDATF